VAGGLATIMKLIYPILLVVAAIPIAEQAIETWLASDSEARWVPFTLTSGNQIRFVATVDGRPVGAILDTGVSDSAMSHRLAPSLRGRGAPTVTANAIGGAVPIAWATSPRVAFGGLDHRGGRIAVVDAPGSATGGESIDLFVGRDLLAGFALEIDYDAGRFRLLPSGRMPFRGVRVPLMVGGAAPTYLSELTIGGRRTRMIVDTGDGNAVTLSAATWRSLASPARVTTTLSYGMGGMSVTELAIDPALPLGPLPAQPTEVAIEPDGGYSQGAGVSGRIGNGLLQRYHVLLDPGAGQMVLAPGRLAGAEPPRSTSGLLLRRDGDRLNVVHVMRGGPAAASGWHTGDTICSVDGATIGRVPGEASLSWPIGPAGRTVQLGLCDGRSRALTLRNFY
jgi:Aspartyl protease